MNGSRHVLPPSVEGIMHVFANHLLASSQTLFVSNPIVHEPSGIFVTGAHSDGCRYGDTSTLRGFDHVRPQSVESAMNTWNGRMPPVFGLHIGSDESLRSQIAMEQKRWPGSGSLIRPIRC